MTRFWRYKIYADIRGSSLGMGRHTTVGLSTTAIFGVFAGYFLLRGNPSEFMDETYRAKTRGMGLPYGENCMILTSTVFD